MGGPVPAFEVAHSVCTWAMAAPSRTRCHRSFTLPLAADMALWCVSLAVGTAPSPFGRRWATGRHFVPRQLSGGAGRWAGDSERLLAAACWRPATTPFV
jgi:hypothetical protein